MDTFFFASLFFKILFIASAFTTGIYASLFLKQGAERENKERRCSLDTDPVETANEANRAAIEQGLTRFNSEPTPCF
jgi:hypothetical protein